MTPDEHAILVAELTDDPLGRYAGKDAEQVKASLAAVDRPTRVPVERWRIKQAIYEGGAWPLLLVAQQHETPAVAGVAVTAVAYLNDPDFETLDLDLPAVAGMLGVLQANGVLSEDLAAAIDALADGLVSRQDELGIAPSLLDIIRTMREVGS